MPIGVNFQKKIAKKNEAAWDSFIVVPKKA